ncbi:MAG: hypothetical protein EOS07_35585, partial [Mesorhizobium sp.]
MPGLLQLPEVGLLALPNALSTRQTAFDVFEAFRDLAECLTPLFSIDNPIAHADFIGLELQLRELVIDPWFDDLLEARFAGIEALRIPKAREIG